MTLVDHEALAEDCGRKRDEGLSSALRKEEVQGEGAEPVGEVPEAGDGEALDWHRSLLACAGLMGTVWRRSAGGVMLRVSRIGKGGGSCGGEGRSFSSWAESRLCSRTRGLLRVSSRRGGNGRSGSISGLHQQYVIVGEAESRKSFFRSLQGSSD